MAGCNFLGGAECPLAVTCEWAQQLPTKQARRAICAWGIQDGSQCIGCRECKHCRECSRDRSFRHWECWKLERHKVRAKAARRSREPS